MLSREILLEFVVTANLYAHAIIAPCINISVHHVVFNYNPTLLRHITQCAANYSSHDTQYLVRWSGSFVGNKC